MNNTLIKFPQMVKHFRKLNLLTMEELGRNINKTKSTISKWESGTRSPKIYEIEEIANYFGVAPDVMMFGAKTDTFPDKQQLNDIYDALHAPRQKVVLETAQKLLKEQEAENN